MTPDILQNLEFFACLPVAVLLIQLSRLVGPLAFKLSILFVSCGLVALLPAITLPYLGSAALLIAAVFVAARFLLLVQSRRYFGILLLTLGLILAFLIIAKYNFWSRLSPALFEINSEIKFSLLPVIGLSYLFLRLYSLVVDVYSGKVNSLPVLDYLLYSTYFPMFVSGPIERFPAFQASLATAQTQRPTFAESIDQLPRLTIGAFKVFVVAGLLSTWALPHLPLPVAGAMLYVGAMAYYWYEYMNFSGYTDMAVSTSRMIGIGLPENFNHPYLATSLTDLWRRWHMTLAAWLRDYIYYPLLFSSLRNLRVISPAAQALLSALAIFLTFVVCGLWHGESWGVLLFGTLSGTVLAFETLASFYWGRRLTKWLARSERRQQLFPTVARVWTFHLAILTFCPVLLTNDQLSAQLTATF